MDDTQLKFAAESPAETAGDGAESPAETAAGDGAVSRRDLESRYYVRFSLAQRFLHGALAGTFLGLAFTGMTLRFSTASYMQAIAKAVGGFGAVLFFHKFFAFWLTVAFLIHVGNIVYRLAAKREWGLLYGPDSMVPRWKDIQDFFGNLKWFFHLGPKPRLDRYAYWDKLDYWGVFWGMGIIGFSGYAMWFGSFFARIIPGSWLNIALLIHGEEAILATGWIFVIHFFNTHLRPDNFPMDLTIFTGRLSEEELKRVHPEEYHRLLETDGLKTLRADAPPRWLKNFGRTVGVTALVSGVLMLILGTVAFLRE
jgi:cytochrome b subunit of formate dehydrogenase